MTAVTKSELPLMIFSTILLLVNLPLWRFMPVLAYFTQFGAVFSAIYLMYERKYILLTVAGIGSLGLTAIFGGITASMLLLFSITVIPGIILAGLVSNGGSPTKSFSWASLALIVLTSLLVIVWYKDAVMFLTELQNMTLAMAKNSMAEGPLLDRARDQFTSLFTYMKAIIPVSMVLMGFVYLLVGWLGLMVWFEYNKRFMPSFGKFIYWKMPAFYVYLFGVCLLIRLFSSGMILEIADNAIIFFILLYSIFGLALIEYFLKKLKLSLFLKVIFYIGIMLSFVPGLILAALAGFFDSYFDFRKVRARIIG